MAILALREKEKQNKLFLLFIVLAVLLTTVVIVGLFGKGKVFSRPTPTLIEPRKIEINFDILKNPALKQLKLFEEIKLPATKGRQNPFLPY
jgi:hypothetical protein